MAAPSLIWVNAESTVMVTRYEDGMTVDVATRPHRGARWGLPVPCRADSETAEIIGLANEATRAALGNLGMGDN